MELECPRCQSRFIANLEDNLTSALQQVEVSLEKAKVNIQRVETAVKFFSNHVIDIWNTWDEAHHSIKAAQKEIVALKIGGNHVTASDQ